MWRYVLRRIAQLIPTTAGVLLFTFALFHVVGGSPAEVALGQHANAASLAAFDARYGYDKPLFCGNWVKSRAWSPSIPLDEDCALIPLFALSPGRWRLRAVLPEAEELSLVRQVYPDGSVRVCRIVDGEFSVDPRACRVELIPKDVSCQARRAKAASGLELQRRTRSFFDSQFSNYVVSLLKGDFGESVAYGTSVISVLRDGIGPSLAITTPILIGGALLALALAMTSAAWRGKSRDKAVLLGSTLLMSVNYVVWILAGQFFLAFKLRLFPIWGFEGLIYALLPVIIGIVSGLGRDIRFFRAVILDEMGKPYVRTAVAKGLTRGQTLWRHVFRNSLIPIVTYISLSIPYLFTGSLLLETFFGIPGLGRVSVNAINSADMATVRAVVILGALLYQIVNLITDLCYAWLDPRVRPAR